MSLIPYLINVKTAVLDKVSGILPFESVSNLSGQLFKIYLLKRTFEFLLYIRGLIYLLFDLILALVGNIITFTKIVLIKTYAYLLIHPYILYSAVLILIFMVYRSSRSIKKTYKGLKIKKRLDKLSSGFIGLYSPKYRIRFIGMIVLTLLVIDYGLRSVRTTRVSMTDTAVNLQKDTDKELERSKIVVNTINADVEGVSEDVKRLEQQKRNYAEALLERVYNTRIVGKDGNEYALTEEQIQDYIWDINMLCKVDSLSALEVRYKEIIKRLEEEIERLRAQVVKITAVAVENINIAVAKTNELNERKDIALVNVSSMALTGVGVVTAVVASPLIGAAGVMVGAASGMVWITTSLMSVFR